MDDLAKVTKELEDARAQRDEAVTQRDIATSRVTAMLTNHEEFTKQVDSDMKRIREQRDAAVEENKTLIAENTRLKKDLKANNLAHWNLAERVRNHPDFLTDDSGDDVDERDDGQDGSGKKTDPIELEDDEGDAASQDTNLSDAVDPHKENEILRKTVENQKKALSEANSKVEVLTRKQQGEVVRDPTVKNKSCDELFAQKVGKDGTPYLNYIEQVKNNLDWGDGKERATVEQVLEILKDNNKAKATETLMKKFEAGGEEGTVVPASQPDDWGQKAPKDFKFANTTVSLGDEDEDEDAEEEEKTDVDIDPLLFATIVKKLSSTSKTIDDINDKNLKALGYDDEAIEEAHDSAVDFLNAKDGEVKKKKVSADLRIKLACS